MIRSPGAKNREPLEEIEVAIRIFKTLRCSSPNYPPYSQTRFAKHKLVQDPQNQEISVQCVPQKIMLYPKIIEQRGRI
jgi:hypothetical protein